MRGEYSRDGSDDNKTLSRGSQTSTERMFAHTGKIYAKNTGIKYLYSYLAKCVIAGVRVIKKLKLLLDSMATLSGFYPLWESSLAATPLLFAI